MQKHRIEATRGDRLRPPSQREAAAWFQIPQGTIRNWVKNSDKILNGATRSFTQHWPQLEAELFESFQDRREGRKVVTIGWLRRQGASFQRLYPNCPYVFAFSNC